MPPAKRRPASTSDEDYWSVDEIQKWCITRSEADAQRVDIAARVYAQATMVEACDLKQEALMRALSTRQISKSYPIWQGIIGIIRSLAYEETKYQRRYIPSSDTIDENCEYLYGESDVSPEVQAQWRMDWPRLMKLFDDAFADKPQLRALLISRMKEAAGGAIDEYIHSEHLFFMNRYMPLKDREKRAAIKMFSRYLKTLRRQMNG